MKNGNTHKRFGVLPTSFFRGLRWYLERARLNWLGCLYWMEDRFGRTWEVSKVVFQLNSWKMKNGNTHDCGHDCGGVFPSFLFRLLRWCLQRARLEWLGWLYSMEDRFGRRWEVSVSFFELNSWKNNNKTHNWCGQLPGFFFSAFKSSHRRAQHGVCDSYKPGVAQEGRSARTYQIK